MPFLRSSGFVLLLMLAGVGCAAPRPAPPSQWPATFSDRTLFFTHSMLVYARDGSAADRAADRVNQVGRDFQHRTNTPPSPGLIIVDDVEDSKIGTLDPVDLLPADEKKDRHHDLEIPRQEIALVLTLSVDKQKLAAQPGFTPAALRTIQWSAATPSDRRIDRFISDLIDAGVKAQHFNFAQRILILPFMPLFHHLIGDAMNAEEDALIYQCLCNAQPGWSEARRKKEYEDYESDRMGEAVKSLKAATQQVSKDSNE